MTDAAEYLRDVIAHINALNASGAAPDDIPAIDCPVCGGDDPSCPAPHADDPIRPDDGPPPTLDQLEAEYGGYDAADEAGLIVAWKQYEMKATGLIPGSDDE